MLNPKSSRDRLVSKKYSLQQIARQHVPFLCICPGVAQKAVTATFHTLHTSGTEQSQFGIAMQTSCLYSELLSMDLEQYFPTAGEHKVKQLYAAVSS